MGSVTTTQGDDDTKRRRRRHKATMTTTRRRRRKTTTTQGDDDDDTRRRRRQHKATTTTQGDDDDGNTRRRRHKTTTTTTQGDDDDARRLTQAKVLQVGGLAAWVGGVGGWGRRPRRRLVSSSSALLCRRHLQYNTICIPSAPVLYAPCIYVLMRFCVFEECSTTVRIRKAKHE